MVRRILPGRTYKRHYDRDGIKVFEGDCLHVIPCTIERESIDAIITDPPFAYAGGASNGLSSRTDAQFFTHWLVSLFKELYRVSKPEAPWFLWADWRTAMIYDNALVEAAPDPYQARAVSQVLIHDREMIGMGSPFRNQLDWIVLIRGPRTDFAGRIPKDQPNIIRQYWYYGKHEHHQSEKSSDIARRLVEWATDPGGLVLDCCMGSGTTLIGARECGRRAIGIDKESGNCETAVRRLANPVKML